MQNFDCDTDLERIARGLSDRSLPKSAWTHAAHFAAALWFVKQHGAGGAALEMPPVIRAYNEATGVANTDASGYHETITLASLRAAHQRLRAHADSPMHLVLQELLRSPLGRADWVFSYWSRSRLFSATARKTWVEPDLTPLPF